MSANNAIMNLNTISNSIRSKTLNMQTNLTSPASNNFITDISNIHIATNMISSISGNNDLRQIKQNQHRLIQSDTYYLSKYKAQSMILKTIIFFCCLGLIGTILFHKSLISNLVFTIYLGILLAILFILIAKDTFNIFLRDSFNFNEFDFGFFYKPTSTSTTTLDDYWSDAQLADFPTCGLK